MILRPRLTTILEAVISMVALARTTLRNTVRSRAADRTLGIRIFSGLERRTCAGNARGRIDLVAGASDPRGVGSGTVCRIRRTNASSGKGSFAPRRGSLHGERSRPPTRPRRATACSSTRTMKVSRPNIARPAHRHGAGAARGARACICAGIPGTRLRRECKRPGAHQRTEPRSITPCSGAAPADSLRVPSRSRERSGATCQRTPARHARLPPSASPRPA